MLLLGQNQRDHIHFSPQPCTEIWTRLGHMLWHCQAHKLLEMLIGKLLQFGENVFDYNLMARAFLCREIALEEIKKVCCISNREGNC